MSQDEKVTLVGVKADGTEHVLGQATMPPKMKAHQLVRDMFGSLDEEAGDAGAMALWACEQLIDWMEKQGTVKVELTQPAIPDLSDAELNAAWVDADNCGRRANFRRGFRYAQTLAGTPTKPAQPPADASAKGPGNFDPPAVDKWRKLAMQFDAQRMAAMAHLRTLLAFPDTHAKTARKFLDATPAEQLESKPVDPGLTVWYGSMPESNGKSNWTAMLHRGNLFDGFTISRSEYPDRVRYDADLVRWLIGELPERPNILNYDGDLHSGYVEPVAPPAAIVHEDCGRKWATLNQDLAPGTLLYAAPKH